jgi:large subunit ribosomal protein L10
MENKKTIRKSHKIKKESVKKLAEQIKTAKTLMIVSVKSLPSKQFQEIKKIIREQVLVKIAKKNILKRAIKELKKESILGLDKYIKENCAFAISDLEGFELAGILSKNKTLIFAKAGQIAPEDISVEAGPTNLVPGPAISELGALGIQITVEDGKISIKEPRVIIKKDSEIKEGAASILQKLDIKPFYIGLEPIAFYDVQTEKIYSDIKINSKQTVEDLRTGAGKALGLAQKIVYYCKETIGYLLAKANSEGDALGRLQSKEEPVEEKKEEVKEEIEEESKTEENKSKEES